MRWMLWIDLFPLEFWIDLPPVELGQIWIVGYVYISFCTILHLHSIVIP